MPRNKSEQRTHEQWRLIEFVCLCDDLDYKDVGWDLTNMWFTFPEETRGPYFGGTWRTLAKRILRGIDLTLEEAKALLPHAPKQKAS